ncbi:helix-turn-helix transcriptional regulator [Methylocapsa aurea]|uniref:helix-turn-helix transcriptional regulator n=1 Tax=Methylocapsa aurea TaxID=663610 RepID=UPI003D18C56D
MLVDDIREWRRRNKYTQDALALALGVSRQTVVGWEKSEYPPSTLIQLALLALENLPEKCSLVAGSRLSSSEQRHARQKNSMAD